MTLSFQSVFGRLFAPASIFTSSYANAMRSASLLSEQLDSEKN
ncbi:hypothetical protein QWZ04_13305 [Vibrio tapetis subsp. quintayensis]|nr:hypothetical protein [Vibrio tapetis]MDN3681299.1 hypothetical protein [Vibrio tapetis subsp. quintayensis]